MTGWTDDTPPDPAALPADLAAIIAEGRYGDTPAALERLEPLIVEFGRSKDPELLLIGLWGKAVLLRHADSSADEIAAVCDLLEQSALERMSPAWAATACALRATVRLDAGDAGAALVDLARVDLDQLAGHLPGPSGGRLLDTLATAYSRLRLHDEVDDVRSRLEESIGSRPAHDRAVHWAHWCTELAARAMEPVASGSTEPDTRLLQRAVEIGGRLSALPAQAVPARLHRAVDAVRALSAAHSRRATEALRLLGQDAFGQPRDLPPLERQLSTLAAIQAHNVAGSTGAARSMDDGAGGSPGSLPHLVLEVCRARERLWLETSTGGAVIPVMTRLNHLLVRLAWQSMDLVAETTRQTLEHQALRVESRTDALTGVGNRRALDEELRSMLRFSPMPLSLVLVDVDDFKRVNDRFTHVVGDEVLRRVAGALSQLLRGGDRLVRYGGDEFVVLLPLTSDQEAKAVAARMSEAIEGLTWSDLGEGLAVGVTTGHAALWSLSHRRPDGDAEELFRLADEQLLEAKRSRGTGVADRHRAGARGRRAAPGQHTPARGIGGSPEATVPLPPRVPEQPPAPEPAGAAPPTPVGLEVFALGEAPLLDELLDEPLRDGALPEYESARATTIAAHATAAGRQLPSSPAAGLPLYRALLQDPPKVDRGEPSAPEPAPPRSRRRPKVIDLTREDDLRSPFG